MLVWGVRGNPGGRLFCTKARDHHRKVRRGLGWHLKLIKTRQSHCASAEGFLLQWLEIEEESLDIKDNSETACTQPYSMAEGFGTATAKGFSTLWLDIESKRLDQSERT